MKYLKTLFAVGFSLSAISGFSQNPNFSYTQTCFGSQTTLVASSSLPDTSISSWKWDLDGNGIYEFSGKTIITLITLNDTISAKLKITPNTGTADSITKLVEIDPLPQVNFMANNLCESKAAVYVSQSNIILGSINQYIWDFNNDGSDDFSGNDTAYYTCGPAATYVTKLRCISDKGCSAFTQKVTTVYPNPVAAFTTQNTCTNDTAVFTNTSITPALDFYLWNFGDGNQTITSGNATHAYSVWGTHAVNLVAVTQNGCRDTFSSSIVAYFLPIASITPSGPTTFCFGNNVTLDAGIGMSYLWSNGATSQAISVSSSGSYNLTVIDITTGCSDDTSIYITVNPLPIVFISSGDSVLQPGGSILLTANGASTYSWSTGSFSNNITVSESGTYSVLGTDGNGCPASDSIRISSENDEVVYVTSVIMTPNGDGINDYLMIESLGKYTNCDLKVYNMWNDEVFSVAGYKNDWYGYGNDGKQVPDGPYYYIIVCDEKPLLKGNINIILR